MARPVFIDGGAGTTGLEIADRLRARGEFTLITLDDADRKDAAKRREAINSAEFVILCLPDAAARDAMSLVSNPAVRVIDASSAHRTADGWVFGFPELTADHRATIGGAQRVTNPGCFSTGFIALIAPLVAAGIIARDAVLTCNAVSGYSGGGKALIDRFANEPDIGHRTYALKLDHKHVPEMQIRSGLVHAPLFAPSVVPVYRGMSVEVPLHLPIGGGAAVQRCLAAHYAGSPVVTVFAAQETAELDELVLRDNSAPSDRLDLIVMANADGSQARLIARLDNLGKGASGACVQSLNLMAGLPETTGLRL